MKRTPAARALVGALALRDGATTNQAFKLAGYRLDAASPVNFGNYNAFRCAPDMRCIVRDGRVLFVSRNAYAASDWLTRLGRKLEAAAKVSA